MKQTENEMERLKLKRIFLETFLQPKHWKIRTIIATLLLGALFTWLNSERTLGVRIVFESLTAGKMTLQYRTKDVPFNNKQVLNRRFGGSNGLQQQLFEFTAPWSVHQIRITPGVGNRRTIESIAIDGNGQTRIFDKQALIVHGRSGLTQQDNTSIELQERSNEAQIIINVPSDISPPQWMRTAKMLLGILTLWSTLEMVWRTFRIKGHRFRLACNTLNFLCVKISSRETIEIKISAIALLLVMALIGCLFVSLKMHQSSIIIWDDLYPVQRPSAGLHLGTPRVIRSDEWNTQTPWVLNQMQTGLTIENDNIGGAQSAFVASTPVWNASVVFNPKFWGFYFLDLERGFSWIWAYKCFGLFSSFFLLFLFLTRGNTGLSFVGALWIYGSSFVQWWYSSHLPEILIGFALAVLGSLYLLQDRRISGMIVGGGLLAFASGTLLMHIYPPFIVPLAYLGMVLVAGHILSTEGMQHIKARSNIRLFVAVGTAILIAAFGLFWFNIAYETIDLMSNTVYPGKRTSTGGDMGLSRVFYGYFEGLRSQERTFPLPPNNASEAAAFFLLFPLLLVFTPIRRWTKPSYLLITLLVLYCILTIIWISLPSASTVREIMAAGGWKYVTAPRAMLGLGIGSIFAITLYFARTEAEGIFNGRLATVLVPFATSALVVFYGLSLRQLDPIFFTPTRLVFAAILVGIFALALIRKSQTYFLLAVIGIVTPSLTVNPLGTGLATLLDKPVLSLAQAQSYEPDSRWVVIGSFMLSQGLRSRGLNVISGSTYVPNMKMMRVLDPELKNANVWNRYTHIEFESSPGIPMPEFQLVVNDFIRIKVDICAGHLEKLGVNRVAYSVSVPSGDLACMTPLKTDPLSGVTLFKISRTRSSPL